MDNNNPDEMSNEDLERAMPQNKLTGNQENVSQSTAAEGTLKTPSQDTSSSAINHHTAYSESEEQDLDDLGHRKAQEDSQDGSLPSPEDTPEWEDDDAGNNNISS